MANNPFTYSGGTPADKMVKGAVNTIEMKNADGSTMTVSDIDEPIIVKRPCKYAPLGVRLNPGFFQP